MILIVHGDIDSKMKGPGEQLRKNPPQEFTELHKAANCPIKRPDSYATNQRLSRVMTREPISEVVHI